MAGAAIVLCSIVYCSAVVSVLAGADVAQCVLAHLPLSLYMYVYVCI